MFVELSLFPDDWEVEQVERIRLNDEQTVEADRLADIDHHELTSSLDRDSTTATLCQ